MAAPVRIPSVDELDLDRLAAEEPSPRSDGHPGSADPAFDRLYFEHSALVRRVVRRYLWGAVVEDVVQEAFAQAFRQGLHHQADDRRQVANYLATITKNRSIDVLRQRMRGVEEIADDGRLVSLPTLRVDDDPERRLQSARRRDGIAEALDTLCERQRRVLVMKYIDGRTYDEIARIEGITVDAVKATLARGRRTFRDLYTSIADARGLSVVLGGFLSRVQARLRALRDRAGTAAGHAGQALTVASPAVTNAVAAVVAVGALAVVGAGPAIAETHEAQPTSYESTEDPGGESTESDPAGADAYTVDMWALSLTVRPETPAYEEHVTDEVATATPVVDAPESEPVHHESDTAVDSSDLEPVEDTGAGASANATTRTDIDGNSGEAQSEQGGEADSTLDVLDVGGAAVSEVRAGCPEPEDRGMIGDTACSTAVPGA